MSKGIFEKVRRSLPSFKINQSRSRLKDIADVHSPATTTRSSGLETSSYTSAIVVGRDDDAHKILVLLQDSNLVTIVGVGGIGKTALARLIYSHDICFTNKLWVSVSDQHGPIDVKLILVNVLKLLNCDDARYSVSDSIEYLQRNYHKQLEGKRVLIILDDIWNESYLELDRLKQILNSDSGLVKILATSRSRITARILGGSIYELGSLSRDDSRIFFETIAFGNNPRPTDFVDYVDTIVAACFNIPLVLCTVGSLLYSQPIEIWETFAATNFAQFARQENEILSILNSSYEHLHPSLKTCFAYCSIFPEGCAISKPMLLKLWKAQGYVVPLAHGQTVENAAEEYFSILLQRGFFQDVRRDHLGAIVSFTIHDLIFKIARRASAGHKSE